MGTSDPQLGDVLFGGITTARAAAKGSLLTASAAS